jgi:RecJ-like exonuclease
MIKLTLKDDGNPIWIASQHVVQVFPDGNGGTTLHLTGQIQSHVKESPIEVAAMVRMHSR